jgi:hypothetical protein
MKTDENNTELKAVLPIVQTGYRQLLKISF